MPLEAMAGPAKLTMSLICEATTEGCKAAIAAAGDVLPLVCGVSVEPSQAPVTLVILLGDDELQARVRLFRISESVPLPPPPLPMRASMMLQPGGSLLCVLGKLLGDMSSCPS